MEWNFSVSFQKAPLQFFLKYPTYSIGKHGYFPNQAFGKFFLDRINFASLHWHTSVLVYAAYQHTL